MNTDEKIVHGTTAWFDMVGMLMCEAAFQAALPPTLNLSLVERYTNAAVLPGGLLQGLRFDIVHGQPSYRVGAHSNEVADITVEVSAHVSHVLNTLYSADPQFAESFAQFQRSGELRIQGDLSALGSWFGAVHDPIVDRTR